MEDIKCKFCGSERSNLNSKRQHEVRCANNPDRRLSGFGSAAVKTMAPWNKGLSKTSDTRVAAQANALAGRKRDGNFTKEGLEKLSQGAKQRGLGGYRPHPNKGQRYKGIWFDSKWEVKVAESLDAAGVKWTRPRNGFIWNDAHNKYYPDFHLTDFDVYLDPKNDYLRIKDELKIAEAQRRNGIKVLVLTESQLNWDTIQLLL